jgi:hypothetical protein
MAEASMRRRYRGLRFYVGLLKLLGVLCLAASVLALVVSMTLNVGKNAPDFVLTLLVTVASLLSGLLLLASAQGCEVLMDIEENTRASRLNVAGSGTRELPRAA